jgi:DNA mismatch repair ATPase MutS
VATGEYVINPSFDDELQDIANKKKRIVKNIKEREDEVRIALGDPSSFKIDNDKTHGWFFRISRKVKHSHTKKAFVLFLGFYFMNDFPFFSVDPVYSRMRNASLESQKKKSIQFSNPFRRPESNFKMLR